MRTIPDGTSAKGPVEALVRRGTLLLLFALLVPLGAQSGAIGEIRADPGYRDEGKEGVRFDSGEIRVDGMLGRQVHIGLYFRQGGKWIQGDVLPATTLKFQTVRWPKGPSFTYTKAAVREKGIDVEGSIDGCLVIVPVGSRRPIAHKCVSFSWGGGGGDPPAPAANHVHENATLPFNPADNARVGMTAQLNFTGPGGLHRGRGYYVLARSGRSVRVARESYGVNYSEHNMWEASFTGGRIDARTFLLEQMGISVNPDNYLRVREAAYCGSSLMLPADLNVRDEAHASGLRNCTLIVFKVPASQADIAESGGGWVGGAVYIHPKVAVHGIVNAYFRASPLQTLSSTNGPRFLQRKQTEPRLKDFLSAEPSSGFWKYMPCGGDYRKRTDCDPPFCYQQDLRKCGR